MVTAGSASGARMVVRGSGNSVSSTVGTPLRGEQHHHGARRPAVLRGSTGDQHGRVTGGTTAGGPVSNSAPITAGQRRHGGTVTVGRRFTVNGGSASGATVVRAVVVTPSTSTVGTAPLSASNTTAAGHGGPVLRVGVGRRLQQRRVTGGTTAGGPVSNSGPINAGNGGTAAAQRPGSRFRQGWERQRGPVVRGVVNSAQLNGGDAPRPRQHHTAGHGGPFSGRRRRPTPARDRRDHGWWPGVEQRPDQRGQRR